MYEIKLQLPFNGFHITGTMVLPVKAHSLVIFAHGWGNTSESPHEQIIAKDLQSEGIGTLMFDLLDVHDKQPDHLKDMSILTEGLLNATQWINGHSQYQKLHIAYLGSGTGAAVAIQAANKLPSHLVKAIISVSGRLDLVRKELARVSCPTLLIVGELDFQIVNINRHAIRFLKRQTQLAIIPGASHLFEEARKQKEVALIISSWLKKYLSDKEVKITI